MKKTIEYKGISRRGFLATAGGLTIGITAYALAPRLGFGSKEEDWVKKEINAWVHLQSNGEMTIFSPAAEMGQGSLTALPVIFAEEMDADWSKVRIEQSPSDPEIFGMKGFRGGKMMLTVGSFTVKRYFDQLRQAGAQARYVLLHSVAQAWGVKLDELRTESGKVYHDAKGKKIAYGDILEFLQIPDPIPEIPAEKLKNPQDFKLIGSILPRNDIPAKVDGSAQFAIDLQVPGMVYGVIERGKVHGAKPTLQNEAAMRAKSGLVDLVELDYGIGIVAESIEQALNLKKELKIDWSEDTLARKHDSQQAFQTYAKIASGAQKGRILNESGNFNNAKRKAAKTYQADFKNDYVYHAQMEPLNAIASVTDQGIEIWAGSQGPGFVAGAVAEAMGIEASQVTFHQQLLGGGLGRRSLHDYIIEACKLSKGVGKPVKLIWTREDDLQYGHYRPLSLQRMQATVDEQGDLTGFSHTIVGDGSNLIASGARNDYYDIPNQHLELRSQKNGIRLKHWRAVGHGPNKFAIEAFIDEIAYGQGIDPLSFRQKLMHKSPKALATLNKAAEMANWGSKPPKDRARGMAFLERSGSLATGICEISLDEQSGKIKVHRFWVAVDAGIIVQPDNVVAQIEGGIIMGIGSVLSEQITIVDGEVQQSNFHDYHLMRMIDIPDEIEVSLIDSIEAPQGVGETGTPLVACAIANAFFALTGKNLRHMPFSPERVQAALAS